MSKILTKTETSTSTSIKLKTDSTIFPIILGSIVCIGTYGLLKHTARYSATMFDYFGIHFPHRNIVLNVAICTQFATYMFKRLNHVKYSSFSSSTKTEKNTQYN